MEIRALIITSWGLEYSILYFMYAFSFNFATRWNRYRSLVLQFFCSFGKFSIISTFQKWERKVIGISGSLIWSKTLMELIFNLCSEFLWSPGEPVIQIHSPHLEVGAPGIFSDLLRSVQMPKRGRGAESNGELPHLIIPGKTTALVPEFAVEDLPSAELQPWFLRLQWRTCPWTEHSIDDKNSLKWGKMPNKSCR